MSTKFKISVVAVVSAFVLFVSASTANAAFTYTGTLKIGSRGTNVSELQKLLNISPATGYYGSKTAAAVKAFQSLNNIQSTGMVGPLTAGKLAMIGTPTVATGTCTTMFDPMTGKSCSTMNTTPNTNSGSTVLTGTTGNISSSTLLSSVETQVGEGQMNKKIVGVEFKADAGSDLNISSLKVTLQNRDSGTSSKRLNRYVKTVSVYADDVKVGSLSADNFSENSTSSDIYSGNIALSGAKVLADKKVRFYVTIDAVDNIDSNDTSTNTFRATIVSARYNDNSGAILTETVDTSSNVVYKDFKFGTLASTNDVELKVNLSSDNLKAKTVKVSTTSQTKDVELLKFTLKAQGSKMMIDQIPVQLKFNIGTGTSVSALTGNVTLKINGETFSESVTSSATALSTVIFDNLDLDLSQDQVVTGTVSADINQVSGNFNQGDYLIAQIPSGHVSATSGTYFDVEDVNGDQLASNDRTGSAIGEAMTFRSTGVNVVMGTANIKYTAATFSGATDQTQYEIPVKVTSFGNTLYLGKTFSLSNTTTASNAFAISFQNASGATYAAGNASYAVTLATSDASTEGNGFRLDDGTTKNFTITVNLFGGNTSGSYRVALNEIQTFTDSTLTAKATSALLPVESFYTGYQYLTK